jgi:NADH-quinone oxidoreductase subunit F
MAQANQILLAAPIQVGADLDAWIGEGGTRGLQAALANPGQIVASIRDADLRGLGGSGFPTWKKWKLLAEQPKAREKYLIVNGNEDEPGTFKDAILLEKSPHQVIEGAIITALACNIDHIVFYINPQLKQAIQAMEGGVGEWQGLWAERIAATLGRPLSLRVMASSGHYIGGEETAAIESVEGKFPFPRGKPPFPSEYGVHGHPTLVNNVETIAHVSHILAQGAQWYRNIGVGQASGTKIYCVSGDVLRPGAVELPMGTSLRELIFEHGGGMLQNKEIKAVFTGGPSNTILTPKDLDVHLDFESVKARNSALGTGAMIVVSEGTGIVKRVTEYVNFFAASSCGQCPPCKTGTFYISQLLGRIDTGCATRSDLESLINLCKILPGTGKCALLNGAVTVVRSSLDHFRDEYESSVD